MFAKISGRLGVALLGAVIAVILNLTLLGCASITSTGAATASSSGNPVAWVSRADSSGQGVIRVVVDCGEGAHAIGGGAHHMGVKILLGSYPAVDGTGTDATDGTQDPRYWAVVFGDASQANTTTDTVYAYAICVAN
jgi:hypothetical protein